MSQYHYHPDGVIILRTDEADYIDTPQNLATDAGLDVSLLPVPGPGERELRYLREQQRTLYFNAEDMTRVVAGTNEVADTLLESINDILAAKQARLTPPPPVRRPRLRALVRQDIVAMTQQERNTLLIEMAVDWAISNPLRYKAITGRDSDEPNA